jgi:polar amino acid transport system substrate-binding protein
MPRALFAALLLSSACAAVEDPLVVASDLDNPPFAGVDAAGAPVGRDVGMMAMLAREIGRELEWRRMPFAQLLPAVEAGEVDIVCATIGVTPERARRVAFTVPYFRTAIAVVARAGAGEPRTLSDLAGRRVSAAAGTTSERAVRLRVPRALGVFENAKGTPALERLLAREVDAAVMDGPAADALVARSEGSLVRLAGALDVELYALALPLEDAALASSLDEALAAMSADGRLRALDARYGLEHEPGSVRFR